MTAADRFLATRLARVVVLFREPDSLALWGIPYRMRPGQAPGDLWRAHRDYKPPKPGHFGSKRISLDDWLWLGCPGWFGGYTEADRKAIEDFLKPWRARDAIPGGPYEWTDLTEWKAEEVSP